MKSPLNKVFLCAAALVALCLAEEVIRYSMRSRLAYSEAAPAQSALKLQGWRKPDFLFVGSAWEIEISGIEPAEIGLYSISFSENAAPVPAKSSYSAGRVRLFGNHDNSNFPGGPPKIIILDGLVSTKWTLD